MKKMLLILGLTLFSLNMLFFELVYESSIALEFYFFFGFLLSEIMIMSFSVIHKSVTDVWI